MKTKKHIITSKPAVIFLGLFIIAIAFVIGLQFGMKNTMIAEAATAPYNNANSANGVRIDGWHTLAGMNAYGRNTENKTCFCRKKKNF